MQSIYNQWICIIQMFDKHLHLIDYSLSTGKRTMDGRCSACAIACALSILNSSRFFTSSSIEIAIGRNGNRRFPICKWKSFIWRNQLIVHSQDESKITLTKSNSSVMCLPVRVCVCVTETNAFDTTALKTTYT